MDISRDPAYSSTITVTCRDVQCPRLDPDQFDFAIDQLITKSGAGSILFVRSSFFSELVTQFDNEGVAQKMAITGS